ncbi:sterol desaturase family protein [Fibrella sp. WM1]|uniref:sterol desaturase family protein n=1 Tax=Fibrella musci TaxID=3242485 RepID=UPI0035228F18
MIDLFVLGWKQSSLKKLIDFRKTTQADIALFFLSLTKFYYFLEIVFSLGLTYAFTHFLPQYKSKNYDLLNMYTVGSVLVVFVLTDFLRYWYHRFFHLIEPLWQLHAYHHSAEELNVLAFYRHHFLEATCSRLISYLPIMIVGNSIYTILPILAVMYTIELLQHSSIPSSWGVLGRYVLISPAAHRVHHSKHQQDFDKNFGQIFVFWDKLFGTYSVPSLRKIDVGLIDNKFNKDGFFVDVLLVFNNFIKAIMLKPVALTNNKRIKS